MFVDSGFGFEDLNCEQKEEILNKVFNLVRNIIDKENLIYNEEFNKYFGDIITNCNCYFY